MPDTGLAHDAMITIENVDKRYKVRGGYKVILEGASVDLPDRNIGLLGANGTGKSTLLRMISGAEKPNAGRIVCDRRVSFPLGFAGSFNGTMSGIENALFTSRIYGQETESVIEYVKQFSELDEQLYMPVQTYSSGMRARLAFGISLAIDFELYLVDEITAVGDARFRERSRAAFKDKLGTANILMVSHSMSSLRDYCDAGAVMQDGKMVYYDDLEDAIEQHSRNMGLAESDSDIDDGSRKPRRARSGARNKRRRHADGDGPRTGNGARSKTLALRRDGEGDGLASRRVRPPRPGKLQGRDTPGSGGAGGD